ESDLPPDPALHFARLDNGLRIAWRAAARPPGHCSLRLVVHVGSREEDDGELGMAHFVEHMAFNGTRRFPGTSIVEWFQRQGMAFGRDVNAFTSFASTTYAIDLPRSDDASVREGLEVLADFATGMLFTPAEVDAEKGVIDAEERERSSPEARAQEELDRRLATGTRYAVRRPIGDRAVRARFDAAALRAFHQRWYRPDNMTLVVVGDFAGSLVGDPLAHVNATLGAIAPPTVPVPPRPEFGQL